MAIYTGKTYESRKTGYTYEMVITDEGYVLDDGEGYAFEVSATYKDDLDTVKNCYGEKFDEVSE
jgi:hypothetical protein